MVAGCNFWIVFTKSCSFSLAWLKRNGQKKFFSLFFLPPVHSKKSEAGTEVIYLSNFGTNANCNLARPSEWKVVHIVAVNLHRVIIGTLFRNQIQPKLQVTPGFSSNYNFLYIYIFHWALFKKMRYLCFFGQKTLFEGRFWFMGWLFGGFGG